MRAAVEEAEVLLLLGPAGAAGEAAALAHIAAVDPPSAGVALTQARRQPPDTRMLPDDDLRSSQRPGHAWGVALKLQAKGLLQ